MEFRSQAANDAKENLLIEAKDLLIQSAAIPDPDIFSQQFNEIELRFDRSDEIFWCYMNQKSRPSYTYELGEEIQQVPAKIVDTRRTRSTDKIAQGI